MKNNILIVSTDQSVISPITQSFQAATCIVPNEVLGRVEQKQVNFVVIDQDCCELNPLLLYKDIKNISADLPVILLSSSVTIPQVVEAARLGIRDIIKKPFTAEQLVASLKSNMMGETERITLKVPSGLNWTASVGGKMRTLMNMMEAAIRERKNILFMAEQGTDVASLVDVISSNNPWGKKQAKLDMLQFMQDSNENVFWTMLQGYVAEANTIYFAHLDSSPAKTRASIIEYVKKRAGNNHIKLLASVRDIVPTDEFSDWIKINVPSLRERKDDLAVMMNSYLQEYCTRYAKRIDSISCDVLEVFSRYSWPGNYRELEGVLENAVLLSEGQTLTLKDVQLSSRMLPESITATASETLIDYRRDVEKHIIDRVYKKTGSKELTAHVLDISKSKIQDILTT